MAQDAREAGGYDCVVFGVAGFEERLQHCVPHDFEVSRFRNKIDSCFDDPLGPHEANVLAPRITVCGISGEGLGHPHEIGVEFVSLLHLVCPRNPEAARNGAHILVPGYDDPVFLVLPRVGHPEAHEVVRFEAREDHALVVVHEVLANLLQAERLADLFAMRLVGLVNVHAERPRLIAQRHPDRLRIELLLPGAEVQLNAFVCGG
ncbi:hypothetical protein SAMN02745126_03995 [Enhydrobacter aerosaccus]|uniref:Uncharacterized protein n=1 Tax=Enhydrobacter aerosaccus TaxID=225324 RepID=A0A1T4RPP4_9HYPH|nr:hypothetical protein [Enhydrobacter aerosaccus]SKA17631.1 hypothetical protein SAMN02745126_03995 [Enhydrobacter aerosaccus]